MSAGEETLAAEYAVHRMTPPSTVEREATYREQRTPLFTVKRLPLASPSAYPWKVKTGSHVISASSFEGAWAAIDTKLKGAPDNGRAI